jgi:hypothetical protein
MMTLKMEALGRFNSLSLARSARLGPLGGPSFQDFLLASQRSIPRVEPRMTQRFHW